MTVLVLGMLLYTHPSTLLAERVLVDSIDALNDAVPKAKPGDEIVLNDGEYSDAELRIHGQGAQAQPILVRAESIGGVKITGESNMRIWGSFVTVQGFNFADGHPGKTDLVQFRRNSKELAQDCRLTRCTIADYNPPDGTSGKWVSIYGQRNRVDHCYIAGKTTEGATLVVWLDGQPNHHRIDHNHFGPRPELGRNGGETIRIGASQNSLTSSATTVENNLFDQCDGEIEIISSKSYDNVYRGNTFDNCDGMLTLRHGGRCTVVNNVFLGRGKSGGGGVRVIGPDHVVIGNHMQNLDGDDYRAALSIMNGQPNNELAGYPRVENANINANVVIDCTHPLTIGTGAGDRGRTLAPKNLTLTNNLFINRATPGEYTVLAEPDGLIARGNLFVGQSNPPALVRARRLARIKLETGEKGLTVPVDIETLSQAGYAPRRLTPADVGPNSPEVNE